MLKLNLFPFDFLEIEWGSYYDRLPDRPQWHGTECDPKRWGFEPEIVSFYENPPIRIFEYLGEWSVMTEWWDWGIGISPFSIDLSACYRSSLSPVTIMTQMRKDHREDSHWPFHRCSSSWWCWSQGCQPPHWDPWCPWSSSCSCTSPGPPWQRWCQLKWKIA